jgi:hypothetical protein
MEVYMKDISSQNTLSNGKQVQRKGRKWLAGTLGALGLACVAGTASADLILYGQENFGGRSFSIDREVRDLDRTRWNDRASSMVVQRGSWEICTDSHFRGNCRVVGPGNYPNLGGFGDKISSARQVARGPRGDNDWRWRDRDRDGWRDRDDDFWRHRSGWNDGR